MTQEEINDLLERPQPTCASMLDTMHESPHLASIADALELSSALSTARAAAARAAVLAETAPAWAAAAWSASAKQLADVVKVIERIDEAAKAGKAGKEEQ